MQELSQERILRALAEIRTPDGSAHLGSLVGGLQIKDGTVRIALEVPSHQAEAMSALRVAAESALRALAGVTKAQVILTSAEQPPAHTQPVPRRTEGLPSRRRTLGTLRTQAATSLQPSTNSRCVPCRRRGKREGRRRKVDACGASGLCPARLGHASRHSGRRCLRSLGSSHARQRRQARHGKEGHRPDQGARTYVHVHWFSDSSRRSLDLARAHDPESPAANAPSGGVGRAGLHDCGLASRNGRCSAQFGAAGCGGWSRLDFDASGGRTASCSQGFADVSKVAYPNCGVGGKHEFLHMSALRGTFRDFSSCRSPSDRTCGRNHVSGRNPSGFVHSTRR